MQKFSLKAAAHRQLNAAKRGSSGRGAQTVYGGHEHALRQTVIALTVGRTLEEHNNPGEAALCVLGGRVRLDAGDLGWEAMSGDLIVIPDDRHRLLDLQDAAVLLSVVKHAAPDPAEAPASG